MSYERADLKLLLRLSPAIVCLFLVANAAANDKAEEQARPLLKAAAERSLLRADRQFPFRLDASFTVHGLSAKRLAGRYSWLLTSSGDWAQQLAFADYNDLQIGRGSSLRVKRSIDFQPLQAALVQNAFRGPQILSQPGDTVDRHFTISDHPVQLRCADISHGKHLWTLCVDLDQNLCKVEFRESKTTYEYLDYRPVGQKFVPYKMVAKKDEMTLLEVSVDKLSVGAELDQRLPGPPDGSIERSGCLTPSSALLRTTVHPSHPRNAVAARRQGQVMLYVRVGVDGKVQKAVVTQTAGEALEAAVLDAVRQWQYDPAMCGNVPVEYETEATVNFSLQIY